MTHGLFSPDLELDQYPVYAGTDLGLTYSAAGSAFRIWSPAADSARMHLYQTGYGDDRLRTIELQPAEKGTWYTQLAGDLKGQYYTFQVAVDGQWREEVPDPYTRAVGVNGRRAMVIDLKATNPEEWDRDQRPPLVHPNDIVLYELHVRDFSIHPNAGIPHPGKFLAFTAEKTQTERGAISGVDHLVDLGITHLHLLPVFDFQSVDETRLNEPQFNWGYDPQNYNVPEGSYATDPYQPEVRIMEFKKMVQSLHRRGIRVVMDVVYNHTYQGAESLFDQLVPNYYYRQNARGGFANGSACGNEIASERPMVRKFILESLKYWVEEYHIDGFRFDLMGLHDIETMNTISAELHAIDSTIFLYGEGWTAGESPLPRLQRALKHQNVRLNRIAAFSDDIRDGIKGHVFTPEEPGFASGKIDLEESIRFGIVAATNHPQVNYDLVNYSDAPWAPAPQQCINYASCHDNHTLWDKIARSVPDAGFEERKRMHLLAGAIVLTSQGVPFLHAGTEMLRTKQGEENSYASPDSINQIDWNRKLDHSEVYAFFRDLIALRKSHPAFRMRTTAQIQQHLRFLDSTPEGVVGYQLIDHANGDKWENILVFFNGNREERSVLLPEGSWTPILEGENINQAGLGKIRRKKFTIPASSAAIFFLAE